MERYEGNCMIVKRVTIDGFKNLKNVALDLSDFTYLISCNNYGKSNVFQALDYVSEILENKGEIPDFHFSSLNKEGTDKFSFSISFEFEGNDVLYELELMQGPDGKNQIVKEALYAYEDNSQKKTKYLIRDHDKAEYKPTKTRYDMQSITTETNVLSIAKLANYDNLYYLDIIKSLLHFRVLLVSNSNENLLGFAGNLIPHSQFIYKRLEVTEVQNSFLYDFEINHKDNFELLMNAMKVLFPDFEKITTKKIDISPESDNTNSVNKAVKYYSWVYMKNLKGPIRLNDASDGFNRILGTFICLIQDDNTDVICIEEPENSINPSLLKNYIQLLKQFSRDDLKIIISSHSPFLTSYDDPRKMYVGVPNENGFATFERFSDAGINKIQRLSSDAEVDFGEYVFNLLAGCGQGTDSLKSYLKKGNR